MVPDQVYHVGQLVHALAAVVDVHVQSGAAERKKIEASHNSCWVNIINSFLVTLGQTWSVLRGKVPR